MTLKEKVAEAIERNKETLGTYKAVGTKVGVSESVVSQVRKGTYPQEDMYQTFALKLDVATLPVDSLTDNTAAPVAGEWVVVETVDMNILEQLLLECKKYGLFFAISDNAGLGKTATLKYLAKKYYRDRFIYLSCWEWGKVEYLEEMFATLGIEKDPGHNGANKMTKKLIGHLAKISEHKPVIILDEFDKLKPAAKRIMIQVYNELKGKVAVVICGAPSLKKEILRGAQYCQMGMAEIASRFGVDKDKEKGFHTMTGLQLREVVAICQANGVASAEKAKEIFNECGPVAKVVKVQGVDKQIKVITNLRRMERLVIREII
jgi:hypothetical protein